MRCRIFAEYKEHLNHPFPACIEFYSAMKNRKPHTEQNACKGYSHFLLLTDDIFKAYNDCVAAGITPRAMSLSKAMVNPAVEDMRSGYEPV